jgi:hypothetical protein
LEETRGVTEVLVRLATERAMGALREDMRRPPMQLRDVSQSSVIDDRIHDRIDDRFNNFTLGVMAELEPAEPDKEIADILEDPRRQMIVRPFHRVVRDAIESLAQTFETAPGLADPFAVLVAIDWWERAAPFAEWSVDAMRDYRVMRREWVWCEAAKQRRNRRRTEDNLEDVFTERLHARAEKDEAARLQALYREALARARRDPERAKIPPGEGGKGPAQ